MKVNRYVRNKTEIDVNKISYQRLKHVAVQYNVFMPHR